MSLKKYRKAPDVKLFGNYDLTGTASPQLLRNKGYRLFFAREISQILETRRRTIQSIRKATQTNCR